MRSATRRFPNSRVVWPSSAQEREFIRGDVNGDGWTDISDAVTTLTVLFVSGTPLDCRKAADANDDGVVDVSDAITILMDRFDQSGGVLIAPPRDVCGFDPTADDLPCDYVSACHDRW